MILKNLFKKKEKLTAEEKREDLGLRRLKHTEEAKKQAELCEERRKDLLQEYNALYQTAIIIIKDFQDYGIHFSFTRTVQTADRNGYTEEDYEQDAINEKLEAELKDIKLINNSFDEEIHKLYTKAGFSFCKSDKEYSYYKILNTNEFYLNEHDWNILTGKTK